MNTPNPTGLTAEQHRTMKQRMAERGDELSDVANYLGQALGRYECLPLSSTDQAATAALVHGFRKLFTAALPGASRDLLDALVELCSLSSGLKRLEEQNDGE